MTTPDDDPFENLEISEDWVNDARKSEPSAQERADRYAKIHRGNREMERQAKEDVERETTRTRTRGKIWPWVFFGAVCVGVIVFGILSR